jgi:CheY-like chemotaxis protein
MARILVVDNEELARFAIRNILLSAGHEVVEAENGVVAVDMCKAESFDLVVTDILMPEKEGIETIIDIKGLHPEQKIIAISGGGRDRYQGYLQSATEFGAIDTLAKPFTGEALLDRVDSCLNPAD